MQNTLSLQFILINYFFDILGSLLILYLIAFLFKPQLSMKQALTFLLVMSVTATASVKAIAFLSIYIDILKVLRPLIILLIKIFIIKGLFKLSYKKSVLICIINFSIMLISESFIYLFTKLTGYTVQNVFNSVKTLFLINSVIYIIAAIIVLMVKNFTLISRLPGTVRPKAFKYIFLNILASVLIMYAYTAESMFGLGSSIILPMFFTGLISNIIISAYSINAIARFEESEQALELQMFYNQSMAEVIDKLRIYKHDMGNTLNAINGYLQLKHYDKLTSYIQELMADISSTNSFLSLNEIKNAALYGILSSKISKCLDANINMQLSVQGEINEITNIKISHLCDVLGIFLDNAIEASNKASKKNIILSIKNDSREIAFIVENTFEEPALNIDRLGELGYSSKGSGRGTGLYIVNRLLNKYPKVVFKTSMEYGYFKQQLVIKK